MKPIALLPFAVLLAGCSITSTLHMGHSGPMATGPVKKETRTVVAFRSIEIVGGFVADVHIGGKQSVVIEAPSDVLPHIITRVLGEGLGVITKGSFSSNKPLLVHITVPAAGFVVMGGGCQGTLTGVTGERFTGGASGGSHFTISGSAKIMNFASTGGSELKFGPISCSTLDLQSTGGSQASGSGTAGTATITAAGAGQANLSGLAIDSAVVAATGAGQVTLGAVKSSLKAVASGASQIHYKGSPKVTQTSTGASTIGQS